MVGLYTETGLGVYGLDSEATGGLPALLPPRGSITCVTGPLNLTAGPCIVNVAVVKAGELVDYVAGAARVTIEAENFYGTGKTPGREWMVAMLQHRWSAAGAEAIDDASCTDTMPVAMLTDWSKRSNSSMSSTPAPKPSKSTECSTDREAMRAMTNDRST